MAGCISLIALGTSLDSHTPLPALDEPPRVLDARLQLTRFASAPAIVTPIGIAIDADDRLFVLESHTHQPPATYQGAASDRVKVFVDADRDGTPDRSWVFADGLDDAMNIAFSPDGELFVVAARGVWALHDRDRDGRSEARSPVLTLTKPAKVYDHAALLGLTFSPDGWLYVSRGNTGGSAWRLEGTDGSFVAGYGDGGNIMRCRPDGGQLQEFATGFWNPFDLRFDDHGRLLAADNDPDSRGPNRLVHVIEGGDYGYKSLYGESGIHPYVAWNGELPGTLPYAVPLGEAPAGLLVAGRAALPADYADNVLVSIWEERRIVRAHLKPDGVSVRGAATPIVEGSERFRPVALAADSRGSIFITDWGLRQYPNHGGGSIWKLTARPGVATAAPSRRRDAEPDAGVRRLRSLLAASPSEFSMLRNALTSDDPFVRSAAVTALSNTRFRSDVVAAAADSDPRIRLGALLALQRARPASPEPIVRALLADADAHVRQMAMIWAGSAGLTALEPEVHRAVLTEPRSPQLFEVYLATLEQFDPGFIRTRAAEAAPYARQLKRVLRPRFLEAFIEDESRPAVLRGTAIRHLRDLPAQAAFLARMARAGNALEVRTEAVRSLATLADPAAAGTLLTIARDRSDVPALRADAVVGLARQAVDATADAFELLDDRAPEVRLEAARHLRTISLDAATRTRIKVKAASPGGTDASVLQAQLAFALGAASEARPRDAEGWQRAVTAVPGLPDVGRRVFFSTASACSQCHAMESRGGELGPDLTNVGQSKTLRQILNAILDPSADVSPEYQGWYIRTRTGDVHTGRQIDVGENGRADLFVLGRGFITIEGLIEYGPMPRSLMPDGLETNLTVDDMRHLVAYLQGSR